METVISDDIFPDRISDVIKYGFECAIEVAKRFVGKTAPNPPVGCTLLTEHGAIISCAAHEKAGYGHAEQLALLKAQRAGRLEDVSTAIVTLEPCNHQGKTPSCAAALAQTNVKTVYIGCRDVNPHVDGGGAQTLLREGIDVVWLAPSADSDSLYGQCFSLQIPFRMFAQHGRPWITVKQALRKVPEKTTMAPPQGQKTFTSKEALTFVHLLRRMTDGIVSTGGTVRSDNPQFTVRYVPDDPRVRRLLIICSSHVESLPQKWIEEKRELFNLVFCTDIAALPRLLKQYQVMWVLIEAGPSFLEMVKNEGFWDDWVTIMQSPSEGESYHVAYRHGYSPLELLPQRSHYVKEQVCFLESSKH